MTRFLHSPFPYLDKLKYRLLHVLIILVFSILFLFIFEPFNIKAWLKYPDWLKDLGLISLALTFFFIIAFSQLMVRTLVPISTFNVLHLVVWLSAEILLLSVILTILFADYTKGYLKEFFITLKFTTPGLVLPYSFSILILVLMHQRSKLGRADSEQAPEAPDLIHFRDERDQVKFSIDRPSILYLESSDNYVTVYYVQEESIRKEMVRISMRKLEPMLEPHGMVRCHRSFMVNLENVHWFKKDGRNYHFKMKNCDTVIPVSRAYVPVVKSLVQQ
jgi:hypothetical protein